MVECVTDADAAVRQAACYGIGVMSLYGGQAYLPCLRDAMPRLLSVLGDARARSMGNIDATENAISAFVKIVRCVPVLPPTNGIFIVPNIIQFLSTS